MKIKRIGLFVACLFTTLPGFAAAAVIPGTDPLTAEVHTVDAERFAALFKTTGSRPDAAQIQARYLDGAGRGVEVFTPHRIIDAANLAAAVARNPQDYRHAIETCLPLAQAMNAQLRATYLAYRGLLPERALPEVHLVFGAGNSGGTANADAQVLGLEVMCAKGTTAEQFTARMRAIFAHETVHSWQADPDPQALRDLLLLLALREGTPEYLAGLTTGVQPSPEREAWARPREAELWREFQRDQDAILARTSEDLSTQPALNSALHRWFYNFGDAPEGWPYEAGYWVGMQIAAAYVAKAEDKRAAINDLIELRDPAGILKASGYGK